MGERIVLIWRVGCEAEVSVDVYTTVAWLCISPRLLSLCAGGVSLLNASRAALAQLCIAVLSA